MAAMSRPDPRRSPVNRVVLSFTLTVACLLAACGSGASTPSPSGSTPSATSTTPARTTTASTASPSGGSIPDQTDTDWGRIWDTLPAGFPSVARSTPSDEAATDPASASLVVDGNAAKSIATSMQTALEGAGFRTAGLSGPLEDGSYVLDSVGTEAACKVQVTASPLGSVTTVTVMYGAACPHD
jgi:hypothetical protein